MRYPDDLKKLQKVTEHGRAREVLADPITIDLSQNFDVRASLDFEYDAAMFALELTEAVQGEDGEWQVEESHEQSPLIFKQNNDHFKTVRREIVAEDVEADTKTKKHSLVILNQ